MAKQPARARFIEPMLLLRTERLPEGVGLQYEIKLDGYRAIAFKTGSRVHLRSRNDKDFNGRYPAIVAALAAMPDETVLDGEVVAFDASGRPSFNALQSFGSSLRPLFYYVFDLLVLKGSDLMSEPLVRRRELLQSRVLSKLEEPIRESPALNASLSDLIQSVKAQGLEGIVAKRLDSRYEPGLRSGLWQKMRVNLGQEFVIGGYTPSAKNFDALIFGYYEGKKLMYVARTRNGFTPSSREKLFRRFKALETDRCPFVNLPEARSGRWGQGLTAEKMRDCKWLTPRLVGQFEFVEWTPDDHLRHSRFIRLSDYVVAAKDLPLFTLGRLPEDPRRRARAHDTATRLQAFLDGRGMPFGQAGHAMGVEPNSLRYAAPTGTVLLRWDGVRQPVIWSAPPPDMEPQQARLELARRYLHLLAPATSESFAHWAGIGRPEASAAFEMLAGELTPARTRVGDAWILADDEAAFQAAESRPAAAARLLPSGDTYYLLWGTDREILVPEARRRAELWTTRVWPGALLVSGEIVGVWRRSASDVSIQVWRRLAPAEWEAVEAEAVALPLPGLKGPITVRRN